MEARPLPAGTKRFIRRSGILADGGKWSAGCLAEVFQFKNRRRIITWSVFFISAGSGSAEKRSKHKSKKDSFEDEGEEKDKRSHLLSHKQQQAKREEEDDEDEMKRGESRWSKRGKASAARGKQLDVQQEVPHHSKEVSGEEEVEEEEKKRGVQRTPEEKELQMIAKRGPEERSRLEEEGSASRKSEV